ACGLITLPHAIVWAGEPRDPYIIPSGNLTISVYDQIEFHDSQINLYDDLAQYFQWDWSSDDACCLYGMTPGWQTFNPAYPGTFRIRTSVQNDCGSTGWSDPVFVYVTG